MRPTLSPVLGEGVGNFTSDPKPKSSEQAFMAAKVCHFESRAQRVDGKICSAAVSR
jgi:hypothetical protein